VLNVPSNESRAWVEAFEFLQLLRLRVQLQRDARAGTEGLRGAVDDSNPNWLDIDSLNDLDRRVLKEALRVARGLQQRMELDYMR
jgi:CBS domain-containing protein